MTEISRLNPDIDYVDHQVFDDLGFVSTIVAGDTVYFSGIAPLRGTRPDALEVVGVGSIAEQVTYVLRVLDDSLTALGLNRSNLVNWTIFTTDMAGLSTCIPIFKDWVGTDYPTSMWTGTTALIHPEMKLEMTAIAVR